MCGLPNWASYLLSIPSIEPESPGTLVCPDVEKGSGILDILSSFSRMMEMGGKTWGRF